MKKPSKKGYGICRLTGKEGRFAKSHIIPRAFTKSEVAGEPRWQGGMGQPVTKRHDSWYDQALCTHDGEGLLAKIDTQAITELRKHKMVWSGWQDAKDLGSNYTQLGDTDFGIRKISGLNQSIIRTFFLSLLWRAAASERWEFAEVLLPEADLNKTRDLVLSGDPGPIDFYPITLTQLSTRGPSHNLTPVRMTKKIPAIEDQAGYSVDIFRFYFEGLVAHIHNHATDNGRSEGIRRTLVGGSPELVVNTVSFDASFQRENMVAIIADAYALDRKEASHLASHLGFGGTQQPNE